MRPKLFALALVAAATASFAPAAQSNPLHFTEMCKGKVDAKCYHDFCGIASCTRTDCLVFSGILTEGNGALCVGLARPNPDPVE